MHKNKVNPVDGVEQRLTVLMCDMAVVCSSPLLTLALDNAPLCRKGLLLTLAPADAMPDISAEVKEKQRPISLSVTDLQVA